MNKNLSFSEWLRYNGEEAIHLRCLFSFDCAIRRNETCPTCRKPVKEVIRMFPVYVSDNSVGSMISLSDAASAMARADAAEEKLAAQEELVSSLMNSRSDQENEVQRLTSEVDTLTTQLAKKVQLMKKMETTAANHRKAVATKDGKIIELQQKVTELGKTNSNLQNKMRNGGGKSDARSAAASKEMEQMNKKLEDMAAKLKAKTEESTRSLKAANKKKDEVQQQLDELKNRSAQGVGVVIDAENIQIINNLELKLKKQDQLVYQLKEKVLLAQGGTGNIGKSSKTASDSEEEEEEDDDDDGATFISGYVSSGKHQSVTTKRQIKHSFYQVWFDLYVW